MRFEKTNRPRSSDALCMYPDPGTFTRWMLTLICMCGGRSPPITFTSPRSFRLPYPTITRTFDDDCPADGAARSQFDFNSVHGAVGDFTERRITEIPTRSVGYRIDIIFAGQEALKLEFPLRIRPRLLS